MERKYPALFILIMIAVGVYGLITYQWFVSIIILGIVALVAFVLYIQNESSVDTRHRKDTTILLAAVAVTAVCWISNLWIVWAVIIGMMYIDYRLEEFRQIFGIQEPGTFLQFSKKSDKTPPEKPEETDLTALKQSLERIEQRLDALEKH